MHDGNVFVRKNASIGNTTRSTTSSIELFVERANDFSLQAASAAAGNAMMTNAEPNTNTLPASCKPHATVQ